MINAKGIRGVSYFDCPGGGQVVVDGTTAYIGHLKGPEATTIVDVSDPANPRQIAQLMCAHSGVHAHKVRVKNGLMLTNYEAKRYTGTPDPGFVGGLSVYDISTPSDPRRISFWPCAGSGIHRFTFDGRYAYISPEMEGYIGNIVLILDLQDPAKPKEVGRWWVPGQWIAGGEEPTWEGNAYRCHHPIRRGNRLYVSYWKGGYFILDIEDMANPKCIAGLDQRNVYPYPTHTVLPLPRRLQGRDVMLVADEDVARPDDWPGAFMWLIDIEDETNPVPLSTFQLDHVDGSSRPPRSGCHQPVEEFEGTEIPVAWFSEGLRIVDVSNPHSPKETAYFVPPVPEGEERVQSNDVCLDDRGLIYLIDRCRGLHILERE
ncbi:MAG: hypothetical protein OEY85_01395 [Rhodospirillales bacterium]|nr:hypothetical protein [Rhodospirillales bacterium]